MYKELGLRYVGGDFNSVTVYKFFYQIEGEVNHLRFQMKNGRVRMNESVEQLADQINQAPIELKRNIEKCYKLNKLF